MSSMSFVISRPNVAANETAGRIPVRRRASGAYGKTATPAKRKRDPTRYEMTRFPGAPRAFHAASYENIKPAFTTTIATAYTLMKTARIAAATKTTAVNAYAARAVNAPD